MKKKNLKIHKFYDALYLVDIQFCYGDPIEFNKYIKDKYDVRLAHDPLAINGIEFSVDRKLDDGLETIYFVFIRYPEDVSTMAHEIIHLVKEIFVDRGINVDLEKDDEALSYYHSYLMKLFMGKLVKPKKKKKLTKKK